MKSRGSLVVATSSVALPPDEQEVVDGLACAGKPALPHAAPGSYGS
jgi:hypothetical protein